MAKAIQAINAGGDYKTLSAINSRVSERAFKHAEALVNAGMTASVFENHADSADKNNNGRLTKDELVSYLSNKDLKQSTKAKVFDALANKGTINPYTGRKVQ